MSRFIGYVFIFVVTVFLTACGGGGGSDTNSNSTQLVTVNGVVVDNYLVGAMVCVDTNKNNTCDEGEQNTTTDQNGAFTLANLISTDDMVIIAYGGKDINTDTNFTQILKNLTLNKDANGTVVLSSLNTLVTDYKLAANTTLNDAKSKIASFLDINDTSLLVSDVVANKDQHPDIFLKSLKVFQIIEKINASSTTKNDINSSIASFNALVLAIKNDSNLTHDKSISVDINGTSINGSVLNMSPVFISPMKVSVNENEINLLSIEAIDDNNISYSISGTDAASFDINNTTGKITFKVEPDYETKSTYTITANATDGTNPVTQNITVTINDLNEPPVAQISSFTISEDTVKNGVLPTATDVDGDTLSYRIKTNPIHGTINLDTNGSFRYTPMENYVGADSFSYYVNDGELDSVEQNVTITINGVNDAPLATYSSLSTDEDILYHGLLTAIDVDSNNLSFIKVTNPTHGTLTIDLNGTFVYTPYTNYQGTDSFSYKVNDGTLDSNEKNVTITINSVNDAPTFTSASTATVQENQTSAIALIGADVDSANLTYDINDTVNFNIDHTTGVVTFKNAPNYETKTSYSFIATVKDDQNLTATQTVTINVTNINEAPVFTSSSIVNVNENQTSVVTLTATDPENSTLTYSISGTDVSYFTMNSSTKAITFNTAPDFEIKSSYTIIATINDGINSTTQTIMVNLVNVNEAPIFASSSLSASVEENQKSAITIHATDADANSVLSYSISGTDAGSFDINSSTGVVTFITEPDYETKNSYSFTTTVKDDGNLTAMQTVTISIIDLNDNGPVFATEDYNLSVYENQTSLIKVITTDIDSNAITYSLSGIDGSLFNVTSDGTITFKLAPDYESNRSYAFSVIASDGENNATQNISVTILDVFERGATPTDITLSANSIVENNSIDAIVGTLSTTDTDSNNFTYSVIGSNDFDIINGNQLKVNIKTDFETTDNYSVTIQTKDENNNTFQKVFSINVEDINEAPIFTSTNTISVYENQTDAIDINGTDPENVDINYSISGTDANYFDINSSTGVVTFRNPPNYEDTNNTDKLYTFIATISDGTFDVNQTVTINILDGAELPIFLTTNFDVNVSENIATTTTVIDIDAVDLDGVNSNLTYTISGTDAASFSIDSTNGKVTFREKPDYEDNNNPDHSYTFSAGVNDQTSPNTVQIQHQVNITILDVNEAPKFASASVSASVDEGQINAITVSATDVDANKTLVYSIVSGTNDDSDKFDINSSTGVITFKVAPDYEHPTDVIGQDNVYGAFTVKATDDGNLSATQIVTITVLNKNEVPTFVTTVFDANVSETNATSNILFTINVNDPENSGLTYSLEGTDKDSFEWINTNQIKFIVGANLDYENINNQDHLFTFNVVVGDGENNITHPMSVAILNVNEAPTFALGTVSASVDENQKSAITVSATDVDANSTLTYSIVSGTNDSARFDINSSTGVITFKVAPDYEHPEDNESGSNNSYGAFTVKVTDEGNLSATQTVTIYVLNKNEVPTFTTTVFDTSVLETNATSNILFTINVNDPEQATLSYYIEGTDKDSFEIVNTNQISFKSGTNLDFENINNTDHLFTFNIIVGDGEDNITHPMSVTILNVNEAPAFTVGDNLTINVNENQKDVIDFNATDVDANHVLTYSIVAGNDIGRFDINSSTGVLTFKVAPDIEHQEDNESGSNNSYGAFSVKVTDESNLSAITTLTVNVLNIPETPVLANFIGSINENIVSGSTIGTISIVDAGDGGAVTSFEINGTDWDKFAIASNGTITLAPAKSLNYEAKNFYNLKVSAINNVGKSEAVDFNLTLNNVNDAPVFNLSGLTGLNGAYSTYENKLIAIELNVSDEDNNTLTYILENNTTDDSSKFDINSSTGVISFRNNPNYEDGNFTKKDANGNPIFDFKVRVGDGTVEVNQTIQLTLLNVNEAPIFTSASEVNVSEGDTFVIDLYGSDVDSTGRTFSIVSGLDSNYFQISDRTVSFKVAPNYEDSNNTDHQYSFIARVVDNDLTNPKDTNQTITVNILNVNEAPVFTSDRNVTVDEGQNGVMTLTATDVDANTTLRYSLTTDLDSGSFNIDSVTGVVTFKVAPQVNDNNTTLTFRAHVTDEHNATNVGIYDVVVVILNAETNFVTTPPVLSLYNNQSFSYNARVHKGVNGNFLLFDSATTPTASCYVTHTGDNTNDINISVSCQLQDSDVNGDHTFTLRVSETNTNPVIKTSQDFHVEVKQVNDRPAIPSVTIGNLPATSNLTAISDVVMNAGKKSDAIVFTMNDGDNLLTQNMTVSVAFSDPTAVRLDSNVTSSVVVDGVSKFTDGATATFYLYGIKPGGESNVTVTLQDNNGTLNGGVDSISFTFKAMVRKNGLQIYQDQKDSNFTINTVAFDSVNYVWNSDKKWYETTSESNNSLNTILLPIKSDVSQSNATYINASDLNISDNILGHYSISKNRLIDDNKSYEANTTSYINITDQNISFKTADGGIRIPLDSYVTHDPLTGFFVSRTIYGEDKSFVDFNATNYCQNIYGEGWKLPTASEVGNSDNNVTFGLVHAAYLNRYDGNALLTKTGTTGTNGMTVQQHNGQWRNEAGTHPYKCVFDLSSIGQ